MTQLNSFSMAELGFVSVAKFLHFVEAKAGLTEVNTSAIFSFNLTTDGAEGLVRRKHAIIDVLNSNNDKIRAWAKMSGLDPLSKEMVVLRSMYVVNKQYIQMCRNHAGTAEQLKSYEQSAFIETVKETIKETMESGPHPFVEPNTVPAPCDSCGVQFDEWDILVNARESGIVDNLLCIKCDPTAGRPALLSLAKNLVMA